MHTGKVLVSDTPAAIVEKRGVADLEEAFIAYLDEIVDKPERCTAHVETTSGEQVHAIPRHRPFHLRRMLSFSRREAIELKQDPIRATLAILGTVILMFVIGYGINMDVENLSFAAPDRDDTWLSRDFLLAISGSRYFIEKAVRAAPASCLVAVGLSLWRRFRVPT